VGEEHPLNNYDINSQINYIKRKKEKSLTKKAAWIDLQLKW
jgi:hypothetical protein